LFNLIYKNSDKHKGQNTLTASGRIRQLRSTWLFAYLAYTVCELFQYQCWWV